MQMIYGSSDVTYILVDNGRWKDADPRTEHYGLNIIETRSKKSGSGFKLTNGENGTSSHKPTCSVNIV